MQRGPYATRLSCLQGAIAGAMGTGALELMAPVERAIVGGPPPFAPTEIAAALCRVAGVRARPSRRAIVGRLLRWSYGPGWGAIYGVLRARLPRSRAAKAASLAGAILAVELVALPPLVGRRLLQPRVLAALGVHVALFAVAVELIAGRRLR